MQKLYRFSYRFIQICSLVLSLLFFAGAFFSTAFSENMETQKVLFQWDNPLAGLLGMAFFFLVYAVVLHLLRKCSSPRKVLRLFLYGWCLLLGTLLIVFGKTVPAADSLSVYSAAEALAGNDTSVIHPFDSYLSYYPQQIGLTAFFEGIIRFWKLLPTAAPAYHFIKCIYVLLCCVILYFQEKTVTLLWQEEKVSCLYLLLMTANLPFFMYSSFIYGEIPSFAAISFGGYFLLLWLSQAPLPDFTGKQAVKPLLLSLLGLSLGVLLRKNNLILIIAVLIVVFLEGLRRKKPAYFFYGIVCLICCLGILPLTRQLYEKRADSSLSSGVTALSYFAMGMQESSRAEGWYNGFNFNTYQQTGMDTALANTISKQAISERFTVFKEHPSYAASFYFKKHLSQWADGTYACRQATLATYGGRSSFFQSLYEGHLSHFFIGYCNIWQNVLYFGILVFCIFQLSQTKRENTTEKTGSFALQHSLPLYLGWIAVVGGFLFHIFWEANARYIFLYSLLLVPYSAKGIAVFFTFLRHWIKTFKGEHRL